MSTFRLGFSGTRKQMDPRQANKLTAFLQAAKSRITEVHHGDCVGADLFFNFWCDHLELPIVVHPPVDPKSRAYCRGPKTTILEPFGYIERNHAIVDATDVLVACPEGPEDRHPRSGTWATIRYAHERGKQVRIIYPDGTISQPQKQML